MVGIAVGYLDEQGMSLGINRFNIVLPNQVPKGSFPVWMLFDTIEECESFISYCYTKLVRFLYFIGICGSAVSKISLVLFLVQTSLTIYLPTKNYIKIRTHSRRNQYYRVRYKRTEIK